MRRVLEYEVWLLQNPVGLEGYLIIQSMLAIPVYLSTLQEEKGDRSKPDFEWLPVVFV